LKRNPLILMIGVIIAYAAAGLLTITVIYEAANPASGYIAGLAIFVSGFFLLLAFYLNRSRLNL
jgi:hypothetical protein